MAGMEGNRGEIRSVWCDLALFAFISVVFRAVFWAAMPRVIDSADAIHYLGVAKQLAAGAFSEADPRIPPLYPALCAVVGFLVTDLELAARLVSLAASVLLVIPVYLICRRLHGRPTARVAALIVVCWPWLADYGLRVAPESLAMLLWFTALWCLINALERHAIWGLFAVLAYGALTLTRPEGVGLLIAAPVVAGAAYWSDERGRPLKRLIPYLIVGGVFLVAYVLVMHQLTGTATVSPRVVDLSDSATHAFVARGEAMARTFSRLLSHVVPVMLGPFFLIFAGVGLFRRGAEERLLHAEALVLGMAGVQWLAAVLSTYPEPRYMMAVVIIGGVYAARGMVLVGEQIRDRRYGALLSKAPVIIMLALMAFGTARAVAPEWMGGLPSQPREYKIAGQWMRDTLEPGLILTRKPQVGFYADMPSHGPAEGDTLERVLERAREHEARYLVVDERYTTQLVPGLRPLLDAANAPASLRLLRDDLSPYDEARIVIYEVLP
jgi:dolichyl-phosphate-mannose-protein mannosyltransferase